MKWLVTLLVCAWSLPGAAQNEGAYRATYTLSFDASWSATTHPQQFPPGPHFSGLIGASHEDSAWLWRSGENATQGIESMAERGATADLRQEIEALVEAGVAESIISGTGIGTSPGSTSLSFEISQQFPLVSITSMIAPSPDWFVGVDSLSLRQGGRWIENLTIELQVFDAGTDSGATYTASNADTNPAALIAPIVQGSLANGVAVGQFRFELQSTSGNFPIGGSQSGVYYNPDRDGEGFYLVVGTIGERQVFSATWFTYVDGQQLWLVGSVDLDAGADVAVVDLLETSGTGFGDAFNAAEVQASLWGTATFRFPGCGLLGVDYEGGTDASQGHLELQSLLDVAGAVCD
jgi:hypothetical protein